MVSQTAHLCPYGKLRVVVGDTTDVSIVDAERVGRCERILKGHEDYGFACAWSPEGYYIATAHQDRLVKIWEVRSGRVSVRGGGMGRSLDWASWSRRRLRRLAA